MSLSGTLNVGASALAAAQGALQVTGNNIANASNPNYVRETAELTAGQDQQIAPGMFMGTGVDLTAVNRQVDEALNSRLRGATSDSSSASASSGYLGQVESTFDALSGNDLSSQMSTFFQSWSDLANQPQDAGQRQVVVQDGETLAGQFNDISDQLSTLQGNVASRINSDVTDANNLAQQIATLNGEIVVAQGGTGGTANGLLDQRDEVLNKLSGLMNVSTVPQADGSINVYVGSEPLVVGTDNRGVATKQTVVNGTTQIGLVFAKNGGTMDVTSGEIGGLEQVRTQIQQSSSQLDGLANNLAFELNKIHSSGQGLDGFSSATATNAVQDSTAALNTAASGLANVPSNGSFVVHVKDKTTGQESSTLVQIDLDGLNGNDTSLNSLTASLNGVSGVTASITNGKLTIAASNSNQEITFSQDSSGVLAALGINTFFTGDSASNIAVNSTVQGNVNLVSAAQNGDATDNQTALSISQLQNQTLTGLQGQTVTQAYDGMINQISTAAAAANTTSTATQTVLNTLTAQQQSLSGVSIDEETINMMQQQRAFQGAARVISTVDQMMQTLLQIT